MVLLKLHACVAVTLVALTEALLVSRAATLPASIQLIRQAPAGDEIQLQIALKHQNIHKLESKLRSVSDPSSSHYGQYLSKDEVNALFAPSNHSRTAVESWLKDAGITAVSTRGPLVDFVTTVAKANELLGADFAWFDVEGHKKLRTTEYSIPDTLTAHIDLVAPTTFFGRTKSHRMIPDDETSELDSRQARNTTTCLSVITPDCLEEAYNYGSYKADPAAGSRVAFASFLNQSARQEDLTQYLNTFKLPPRNFTTVLINGGEDHQDPNGDIGEANLDAQFLAAVTKNLPLKQFITGGSPPFVPNVRITNASTNSNEPYLDFYETLLATDDEGVPQVLSSSYGDDEQTVPVEYAKRVCNLIGMMGLRGVTVLESSGDAGVGAPCRANDGSGRVEFTPTFPGTCPYLTAVGGTQAWAPEVAWVGSAGGFSNYFERAWYQKAAVKTYLKESIPVEVKSYYKRGGFVDFGGRGFPDISAHSLEPWYQFVNAGRPRRTGGTSAAAPVVAGIIGLLNDARLRAGQPTMGFLNPWLYARGVDGLLDVTEGKAEGCGGIDLQSGNPVPGAGVIPWASWNATKGWDPVTGLGLPDFEALRQIAVNGTKA
ncbi:Tripeptidyl-peptidase sed4 like protein [Verticillium longisporum]|nr:Tripeptidyl-peptidase sed4 like protein [Verticillium longisporum]